MDDIEDPIYKKLLNFISVSSNVQFSGVNANILLIGKHLWFGSNNFRNGRSGGHLSHGAPITLSGKVYRSVTYGVHDDGYIDYEQVENRLFT